MLGVSCIDSILPSDMSHRETQFTKNAASCTLVGSTISRIMLLALRLGNYRLSLCLESTT